MMILMLFWLLLALFLDQFSKKIIVELVKPGEMISVLGDFLMITNVGNTGISFGMFQGYTHILIPLVFVIIGLVFIVSLKFIRQSPWLAFAFGAIIGGALGNQIDRLFKGAVVDFVYVNGFAVFNVSDSFVVVGAFILGFHTIFATEKNETVLAQQNEKLQNRIANIIRSGAFDSFGDYGRIKEAFIRWLFNEKNINTIILSEKNENDVVAISVLNANLTKQNQSIVIAQDINYQFCKDLLSEKEVANNQYYDVFYISAMKKLFKTHVLFENERRFHSDSIYNPISYEKKKNKKLMLKLYIAESQIEKKSKKEIERRPVIMANNDFILEIVTEEIPPTEISGLKEQFEKGFSDFLQKLRIKHENMMFFYAARRFGIYIHNLASKQDDLEEIKRGPAKKIAFDSSGNPSKALMGFLTGNQATKDDLIFKAENSNEYCYIKRRVKGESTKDVLEKNIPQFLEKLNFKKPMRWAEGKNRFVRPIHNILSILSTELVEFRFLDIHSKKTTLPHRFKEGYVHIESADVYFNRMMENYVFADQHNRREKIQSQIRKLEQENEINIPTDEDLIEEITAITEFPNAVLGKYDERFLKLPKEVLITTLKHHQRTFPVLKNQKIIPSFLSFQDNRVHAQENVKSGYRKVIEARLEDALFYYHEDLKKPFEKRTEDLKEIGFQNKLGSLYEKVLRVKKISTYICKLLDLNIETIELVKKTCLLMKNDLTTQMVYEFPELQGIMGRIYSRIIGEPVEVYQAIEEQYAETTPETLCGAITTLSDNLDTIAGNLFINNIPSGSKDPFGLRRALTKCLNIIISREWDLDLNQIFIFNLNQYDFDLEGDRKNQLSNTFIDLLKNRIEYFLSEKNVQYDVINATLHLANHPIRCFLSAMTLMDMKNEDDFEDLTCIFERVHNITKKHSSHYYDARLFEHDEEIQLEEKFNDIRDEVTHALERFDYKTALNRIKDLRVPIDTYFDNVFVMSEREDLRLTRLGFLKTLDDFLLKMGDFNQIVQSGANENE